MQAKLQRTTAFFQHEAAGGLVLLAAAVAALIVSNSPLERLYDGLLETPVSVRVGMLALDKPLLLWINDGLMAVFFFLVGLEIKRELLEGELSTFGRRCCRRSPPSAAWWCRPLIYVAINAGDPAALRGWAIPSATDIAFAVGVLALLGPRVPASLKVFLLALAILDDLGAILIIAALLHRRPALAVAAAGGASASAVLVALNLRGVTRLAPYMLIGPVHLGVRAEIGRARHARRRGRGARHPARARAQDEPSLLEELEERCTPWVAFGILPLFAFANAGVSLAGMSLGRLVEPVPLGIVLGLFVGKPLGILARPGWPSPAAWRRSPRAPTGPQILGVGMLAGIGFTMSLFIGMLAFSEPVHAAQLRLGVLAGSLVSAVAGYLILRLAAPAPPGSPA